MPRRRFGSVRESLEELEELALRYRGTPHEKRIELLRALRRKPDTAMTLLAQQLGYEERQLRRWWSTYCRGGLACLIGGLCSARDGGSHPARANTMTSPSPQSVRNDLSTRMQRFLNAMPLASDSEQWMQEFHRGLKDLLDGVDVVMLTVNLATTTITSEASAASAIVNRPHKSNGPDGRRGSIAGTLRSTPGELLVAQNIQRGFPASHYQKPVILDYHAEGHYVGTIALWRLRSAPTPVPRSTLVLLRSLERFIAFALSDCISRHHNRDASLTTFQAAIERASERIGLTRRELDVFALQLVGLGRTCIAERLGIGVSAVAQHMQSIRRKSGATSLLELFVPF